MKHLFANTELRSHKKAVFLPAIFRFTKMFEPTATYTPISSAALSSSITTSSSHTSSSFGVSTSLGSSFSSSFSTKPQSTVAPISVRTSDKTIRSFSTGGVYEYAIPKGVGSFVTMHKEVSDAVFMPSASFDPKGRTFAGKPTDPPIGETYPDLPIGDALLPMLLMAGVYCLMRFVRHRKKMQLATKSVNNPFRKP